MQPTRYSCIGAIMQGTAHMRGAALDPLTVPGTIKEQLTAVGSSMPSLCSPEEAAARDDSLDS